MEDTKIYYRRSLPHYQPVDATFFVTFRLAGSLPTETIIRLKEERVHEEKLLLKIKDEKAREKKMSEQSSQYFIKFDKMLDDAATNRSWLSNEQVARMIAEAMHARDKKVYELLTYCIMPNHVHIVFTVDCRTKRFALPNAVERSAASFRRSDTSPYTKRSSASLYRILQSLKAYTARRANEIIGQKGAFWQHESYDHVVRDGKELERIIDYVLHNPVKAGKVSSREQWKWSYCRENL